MITPKLIGLIALYLLLMLAVIDISVILSFPLMIYKSIDIPILKSFSEKIWLYYGNQCHQLPFRSLFWMEIQLPVCTRCLFIRIGELVVCVTIFFIKNEQKLLKKLTLMYCSILPPVIIEMILKLFFNYHSGFWIVSLNGLFIGVFLYSFYAAIIILFLRNNSWKLLYLYIKIKLKSKLDGFRMNIQKLISK